MTIADLKEKLKERLEAGDLIYTLNLLDKILLDNHNQEVISMNRGELKKINDEMELRIIDYDNHALQTRVIKNRISALIGKLKEIDDEDDDDTDINEAWDSLTIVVELFKVDEINEETNDDSNAEVFSPEEGEKALYADIHEPGKNIPPEEARKFKKLMSNIQDEIRLGDPDAYLKCKEAAEIIHDSAQVHELLMLAYLHQETAEKIVENILDGNNKNLKQLQVYSDRVEKYNKAKTNYKTTTDAFTKKYIVSCILNELASKYKSIQRDFNKTLDGNRRAKELQYRANIKSIIDASIFIYKKIYPSLILTETIKLELIGAGIFLWRENEFNVKQKWDELNVIIDKITAESAEKNVVVKNPERINNTILSGIKNKYMNIKPYHTFDIRASASKDDLVKNYLRMINIINALKTAYKVTKKKGLIQLAIDELIGENAKLRWFHLNLNGELIPHNLVPKDFNTPEELKNLAKLIDYSYEEYSRKILLAQKEIITTYIEPKNQEGKFINLIKAINVNNKVISQVGDKLEELIPLLKQSILFIKESWCMLSGESELKMTYNIKKKKVTPSPKELKAYSSVADVVSTIDTLIQRTIAIKHKVEEIGQPELLEDATFFAEITSDTNANEFMFGRFFASIKEDIKLSDDSIGTDHILDFKKQTVALSKLLQLRLIIEQVPQKGATSIKLLSEINTLIDSELVKKMAYNSLEKLYINDRYYSFPSEKIGLKEYKFI